MVYLHYLSFAAPYSDSCNNNAQPTVGGSNIASSHSCYKTKYILLVYKEIAIGLQHFLACKIMHSTQVILAVPMATGGTVAYWK